MSGQEHRAPGNLASAAAAAAAGPVEPPLGPGTSLATHCLECKVRATTMHSTTELVAGEVPALV